MNLFFPTVCSCKAHRLPVFGVRNVTVGVSEDAPDQACTPSHTQDDYGPATDSSCSQIDSSLFEKYTWDFLFTCEVRHLSRGAEAPTSTRR